MNKTEAINKINEIQSALNVSNRVFVSANHMLSIGICLILVPILEYSTDFWTFGADLPESLVNFLPLIKGLFYGSVFWLLGRRYPDPESNPIHPLIKRAFSIGRPILVAMLAVALGLCFIGQDALVYPLVFIMLGLFYNILGRFSHSSITQVSWLYLGMGFVYICLTKYDIPMLWGVFLVLHGLTCLYMGLSLKKGEANED